MRALLFCLLVGLTACTSAEEDPPAAAPTVDEAALADGLAAVYAGDNPDPDDVTEGDCFADALLASTTPEELRAGGLVDASYAVVSEIPVLDADLAGPVADAQLACTDFVADSTAAQVESRRAGSTARRTPPAWPTSSMPPPSAPASSRRSWASGTTRLS